jgi:hypothetical protein
LIREKRERIKKLWINNSRDNYCKFHDFPRISSAATAPAVPAARKNSGIASQPHSTHLKTGFVERLQAAVASTVTPPYSPIPFSPPDAFRHDFAFFRRHFVVFRHDFVVLRHKW